MCGGMGVGRELLLGIGNPDVLWVPDLNITTHMQTNLVATVTNTDTKKSIGFLVAFVFV
jgi:hypothetical protein